MTLLEYMEAFTTSRVRKCATATFVGKAFKNKEELQALPTSDDVYDHLFFRATYDDRRTLQQVVENYRKYCREHGMTPDPINVRRNIIY